ncbi:beta-amyrin 6-beta-monooxygenase-like [Coffea arabica]|uniref:Beta-amyrin 6-beta-monooxygenase-like n=1 Tax=Coffea arabica TaxID=13443 RepID=A0A6P6SXK2_COFAR|nr:beta-amyrin 28-monooxygenase-like [Coffea arabica]
MEAFYLYFLSLLVVFISISVPFLCHRSKSKKCKLPPGSSGFPLVGETLHFLMSGPEKFIHQRMEKYSDQVFATSLMGQNLAVICGAAGNKFLLCTANDFVSPWLPDSLLMFLNWVDSPGKSRKDLFSKIRGFHQAVIMRPEALKQYIPIMDSLTRQHLQTDWDPFHVVKVHPASQKITLILACKLLLGLEPDQAQRFSDSFTVSLQAFYSLPINLPGTAYNRALKEVDKLKQEFLKIILERKKMVLENREKAGSDVLSRTLLDENAHLLSDLEFAVYLVSLMIPTYESGSASITFVLKHLAELPHIYDMVYKEHMEIAKSKDPEELLNWEDVKKMKYSWNVICEAMRLAPPATGAFREVETDIHFAGVTIPKGWKVLWSPFTTNKNPKYFSEPENFDPTRFEGDGPTPCTFIPFSTGPRMCPGKDYSRFLILVYMYNVVRKFKLKKLIPDDKVLYRVGPYPASGLPLRLQPH